MKKLLSVLLAVLMTVSFSLASAETVEAVGSGFAGDIKLAVTIENNAITAIEVLESGETPAIGGAAMNTLIDEALAGQTADVDAIGGATFTSKGFVEALSAAMEQAGFVAAEGPKAETVKEEIALEADIVVCGGGAAGLTAGLTALQQGKTVILLEKMGVVGGASAMAGSGTMATGSKWQKEDGFEDSPEKLVEDMMKNGHGKNDRATVELFASIIGDSFDWLVAEDGAAVPYQRTGDPTRTYSGVGRGSGVCSSLSDSFVRAGGVLILSTPATALISENGVVTGVMAESKTASYTISAKAVILATGGYGANDELVPDEYKKFVYAGHAGAEGDAIAMVAGLDADLIDMDLINTQPNSMVLPSGLGQYTNPGVGRAYKAGAYMVNENGVRFVNEVANAWDIMQEMKKNACQYLIMDQAAFDGFNAGMTASKIYAIEKVDEWLNDAYEGQPVMKKADTLEALAEKLGLPADAVAASAAAFNAAVGTTDEFGRSIAAAQSVEGPFYALQLHIRYYASLGGLHINDQLQVLNKAQQAIPGLYAAGEVIGGVEGDVYMGATLFGWAVASGHTAGANAAAAIQ